MANLAYRQKVDAGRAVSRRSVLPTLSPVASIQRPGGAFAGQKVRVLAVLRTLAIRSSDAPTFAGSACRRCRPTAGCSPEKGRREKRSRCSSAATTEPQTEAFRSIHNTFSRRVAYLSGPAAERAVGRYATGAS